MRTFAAVHRAGRDFEARVFCPKTGERIAYALGYTKADALTAAIAEARKARPDLGDIEILNPPRRGTVIGATA